MAVKVEIKDYQKLKRQIERMKKAPEKALKAAENDIRDRAPGWIAAGVADRYAISNGEGAGKNISKKEVLSGKVGTLRIKGSLKNNTMVLEYSGRPLTPMHFGMNPIKKPTPGSAYTLKWKVLRGGKGTTPKIKKLTKKQLKNIGRNFTHQSTQNSQRSPWMLQPTGAKDLEKTQYIPFQRRGQTEPFKYVARGPSLPQMVTKGKNGPLRPEVAAHFNENLEKRITHNINRFMLKK